ncbi:hypothetical protein EVAR_52504_1 [Eumeta japonica]|uniref:Uncharacterized protein n=1 Tax=Eumeta variegata TaxID=151549 RepID=A0A4C1ZQR4_EUMVA|nr:hypothetical protein EVAR_52504_1 [Eumeta japonica]
MRSPPSSDFSLVPISASWRTDVLASTHRLFVTTIAAVRYNNSAARAQITPRPPESAPAPTRVAATCRRPHRRPRADPRTAGRAPPAPSRAASAPSTSAAAWRRYLRSVPARPFRSGLLPEQLPAADPRSRYRTTDK